MALSDFFRRRPAVRDRKALADFIDRNAAFLIQKAIYEYSRARAGHYSKVLFKEPSFHKAVDVSRWRAYPLGLVMVAEVVYAVFSRDGHRPLPEDFDTLEELVLSVFDRYPVPSAIGEAEWKALRADLELRLRQIALHPPKRAMDIAEPYAQPYFELMPIHEKLRGRDLETTRNYLKVTLCNIHDELTKASGGLTFPALAAAG